MLSEVFLIFADGNINLGDQRQKFNQICSRVRVVNFRLGKE
jgi:hypothetical protein